MNIGKTFFAQIVEFVPWTSFSRIVARYVGDLGVRPLTCSEQFRVTVLAQLAIEAGSKVTTAMATDP